MQGFLQHNMQLQESYFDCYDYKDKTQKNGT